ncbi:MAG: response regulator [Lamprocystis purpurea]|jgi:signal transduction histidine kinase|uniref:ATP-binding protein n=1 Tax=Lamprocystis purpurea TaxID=61598 RepID=UPI000373724C|nr:ATP-binding protein [Lamprocystis purpurea]MBV5274288.1 response regulator [Lamprocystis purpurea]
MSDPTDLNDLTGQIAELQARIARSAVVRQQLMTTQDDLNRTLERFAGIQSYNTRAIAVRDQGVFAEITAEAVMELFDLSFGLLWLTAPDGTLAEHPAAVVGIAPATISAAALGTLLADARFRRDHTGLWSPQAHPLLRDLGLRQLVASACIGPSETGFAVVLGGVTARENTGCHELTAAQLESFTVFAQQIGALLQNRSDQALIEAQRERAEAASRAKSEFLATVSHELFTPMNGVLGMLHLLQSDNPTPEQVRHIVLAQQAGDRLLHIIQDILDMSTLEAGALEPRYAPLEPGAELQSAAESLRDRCTAKGLNLVVTHDPALPTHLLGDARRLRQIAGNLIDNAIKFTDRGTVTVAIGGAPLSDDRYELMLAVSDTGIGISTEIQTRLFTPFTQADASFTRRHGGAGLGLAICRRLLDLMGGRISVDSQPDQGACFKVQVPLSISHTTGAAPRSPAPVPPAPPRVLLVEDNLVGQKVATAMLERLGCSTLIASNGLEALDTFGRGGIEVVLMDVQMPIMDGFEATRLLRDLEAERGWPRTPVLALTANTLDTDRNACLAAGMDDFVAKPMTKAGLRDALGRWVDIGS